MIANQKLLPEVTQCQESPIYFKENLVGWHSIAIGDKGPLGARLSIDKNIARRIAVAETLERKIFDECISSPSASELGLPSNPSTCGFAVGFEDSPTRLRSLCEAVERWAWSQWIDEGFELSRALTSHKELPPLGQSLANLFDEVLFFKINLDTSLIPNSPILYFGVAIGVTSVGVFPGSRVGSTETELWEHSLIECWRHLVISKDTNLNHGAVFPFQRIKFFAKNKALAFEKINAAKNPDWRRPKLRLQRQVGHSYPNVFCYRSLIYDYLGWEVGNVERFVY